MLPGVPEATPIYRRERLLPGMQMVGPAIIEEATTTTVVGNGQRVEIDRYGGLHVHLAGAGTECRHERIQQPIRGPRRRSPAR